MDVRADPVLAESRMKLIGPTGQGLAKKDKPRQDSFVGGFPTENWGGNFYGNNYLRPRARSSYWGVRAIAFEVHVYCNRRTFHGILVSLYWEQG
jgi:hypothetical protein